MQYWLVIFTNLRFFPDAESFEPPVLKAKGDRWEGEDEDDEVKVGTAPYGLYKGLFELPKSGTTEISVLYLVQLIWNSKTCCRITKGRT